MDNSPISRIELLGRNITFPVSFNKREIIKAGRFYPYNREDVKNSGFFTNKISMVRLCKACDENGIPEWKDHIARVVKGYENKSTTKGENYQLRAFLVVRADDFLGDMFDLIPDASSGNPYHMHAVIRDYVVPFRKVSSVGEVIPDEMRYQLDMLQKKAFMANVNEQKLTVSNADSPCVVCRLI